MSATTARADAGHLARQPASTTRSATPSCTACDAAGRHAARPSATTCPAPAPSRRKSTCRSPACTGNGPIDPLLRDDARLLRHHGRAAARRAVCSMHRVRPTSTPTAYRQDRQRDQALQCRSSTHRAARASHPDRRRRRSGGPSSAPSSPTRTIIGVIDDMRFDDPRAPIPPTMYDFVPRDSAARRSRSCASRAIPKAVLDGARTSGGRRHPRCRSRPRPRCRTSQAYYRA